MSDAETTAPASPFALLNGYFARFGGSEGAWRDMFDGLGEEQTEALAQSALAAIHGLNAVGDELVSYNQRAYEEAVAAIQALGSARSLGDAWTIQAGYVQSAVNGYVAEMARLAELSQTTALSVLRPFMAPKR